MANATVYFATNRKPNDPDNPTDFTTDPVGVNDLIRLARRASPTTTLRPRTMLRAMPSCRLSAPPRKSWSRRRQSVRRTELKTAIAGKPPFAQLLASTGAKQADALVCIHGYDYTFRGLRGSSRTAPKLVCAGPLRQAAACHPPRLAIARPAEGHGDLHRGATALADRRTGDGRAVMETVARVKGAVGVERVHLLAHSMGNWALRWAVQSMEEYEGGNIPPLFEQYPTRGRRRGFRRFVAARQASTGPQCWPPHYGLLQHVRLGAHRK